MPARMDAAEITRAAVVLAEIIAVTETIPGFAADLTSARVSGWGIGFQVREERLASALASLLGLGEPARSATEDLDYAGEQGTIERELWEGQYQGCPVELVAHRFIPTGGAL